MPTRISETPKQFLGVQAFDETDLETVRALTLPPGTNYILMQAQNNFVIWHPGGDTPAEGNGFAAAPGETVCIFQDNSADVRVIRGAAGATLFVAYYR